MKIEDLLLVSPSYVKTSTFVNYNIDDIDLAESIKVAQNIYLKEIIGEDLLNSLKELEYNAIKKLHPNIDENDYVQYKTLLDDYIKPLLSYKAQAELCVKISYKLRNYGVSKDNDTNISSASYDEIINVRHDYETYYCDACNNMVDFLLKNKASFPEIDYNGCSCGKGRLYKKYANTNLYLGE